MYNMLLYLYGLLGIVVLYIILSITVKDRLFGRAEPKRKKSKKAAFRCENKEETDQNIEDQKHPYPNGKLKLPEELDELEETWEDGVKIDESINSLSLGSGSVHKRKSFSRNGSWFKKDLKCNALAKSMNCEGLIWPARFTLNGTNVDNVVAENGIGDESKTSYNLDDFSDGDSSDFRAAIHKVKNGIVDNRNGELQLNDSWNFGNTKNLMLILSFALNLVLLYLLWRCTYSCGIIL